MKLLVNLYAGPGTGKTTIAAGVFHKLKMLGINCEYIQEYAKDKTWQGDMFSLGVQPYMAAKQLYRQERLRDKVEVAITDGALLNSLLYPCKYVDENFEKWLVHAYNQFPNYNIFLIRNSVMKPYEPAGRRQTEEEARELDDLTEDLLERLGIERTHWLVREDTVDRIVTSIQRKLLSIRIREAFNNG